MSGECLCDTRRSQIRSGMFTICSLYREYNDVGGSGRMSASSRSDRALPGTSTNGSTRILPWLAIPILSPQLEWRKMFGAPCVRRKAARLREFSSCTVSIGLRPSVRSCGANRLRCGERTGRIAGHAEPSKLLAYPYGPRAGSPAAHWSGRRTPPAPSHPGSSSGRRTAWRSRRPRHRPRVAALRYRG